MAPWRFFKDLSDKCPLDYVRSRKGNDGPYTNGDKPVQGFENNLKTILRLLFQIFKFLTKCFIIKDKPAKFNKCPHDLNIDLDGSFTIQNKGRAG
ncbi:MAG: hypothetical protein DSY90_01045 [Deltaproteobacteria bacterium]|nr:MAG: hypothetical protein DSY90_01045 [Deltaproteobacteria bacterium]